MFIKLDILTKVTHPLCMPPAHVLQSTWCAGPVCGMCEVSGSPWHDSCVVHMCIPCVHDLRLCYAQSHCDDSLVMRERCDVVAVAPCARSGLPHNALHSTGNAESTEAYSYSSPTVITLYVHYNSYSSWIPINKNKDTWSGNTWKCQIWFSLFWFGCDLHNLNQ